MGLDCMGALIHRFFSVVNTTVLYHPQIRRNLRYGGLTISYMQIFDCGGSVPITLNYFLKTDEGGLLEK